jgi:hypothetical protein
MSMRYGLESASDLFAKLERDAKLLEDEVTSDRFLNFVVTAYHLCEWVEKDNGVGEVAKGDVRDNIRETECIKICRDLANASKHFELNGRYRNQTIESADSNSGFGEGRYGKGGFGEGEQEIRITLLNNREINALDLKNEVIRTWSNFFERHNL